MKLGSLFDGSGGFPLAGSLCEIEPVWASEIEPYPIAVTKSRFPNMKHLGSVTYADGELAWTSFEKTAKCFDYPFYGFVNREEDRIHPMQKPIALYEWLLTRYAKPGYSILDTHVGSASSLIACERMGFDYVGFELNPEFYERAQKRMEQHRNQITLMEVF